VARRPDGRLVAALNRNGGVEIVDLATGDVLAIIRDDHPLVVSALSPTGTLLSAWCPERSELRLFDVDRSVCLRVFPSEEDLPVSRIGPDDSRWAVYCRQGGILTVLDVASGQPTMELERKTTFPYVAFGPEGDRLLCDRGDILGVFSTTGELLASSADLGDTIRSVAVSPDGRRLAVGHGQRSISILDSTSLQVEMVLHGHGKSVRSVAFSPDGTHLASASQDRTVRIWSLSAGETVRVLMGTSYDSDSLVFSSDGSMVAAGTPLEARLWKWKEDGHRVLKGHGTYVYHVSFNHDGSLLASGAFYCDVRLWDPVCGEALAVVPASRHRSQLNFTPDGQRVIYFDDGRSDPPGIRGLHVLDSSAGVLLSDPRLDGDESLFRTLRGDGNLRNRSRPSLCFS